ncbi:MAG: hypothetical protein V2B18_21250 [Pseudomonadota bacterium]
MSDISDIRTDITAKLTAAVAAFSSAVAIDRWAGEEKAIKMDAVPAVLIQWTGRITEESMEIGASTYMRSPVFVLYVVADDVSGGAYGDDICSDILELADAALNEASITIGGVADVGISRPYPGQFSDKLTESLIGVHAGRYLYGQAWYVERLVS